MYNEYTPYSRDDAAGDISTGPRRFGMPGREVDGQDVRGGARGGLARRWSGRAPATGPTFLLDASTYRYRGHHVGDVDRALLPARRRKSEQWRGARPDRTARALARATQGSRPATTFDAIEADVARRDRARGRVRRRGAVPRRRRGERACLRLASRAVADTRTLTFARGGPRGARRGDAPRPTGLRHRRGRRPRRARRSRSLSGLRRGVRAERVVDTPISEAGDRRRSASAPR